ncbi:MAG: protein translocase subunit SecD, partial [Bacteroidota bacterium]
MKGKSGIITLTAIISVLCLYYLSFTFVARNVQSEAATFATDSKGNVDFAKKQKYLDSMWIEPVYNLGFATYTYEDVKKNELALGLDLQGGMHVVLEVSPGEIVKAMAGSKSKNPQFQKAIELAKEKQKNSQASFATLFAEAFKELNPQVKLAQFFANINYKELNSNSSNDEVIATIEQEMEGAVDRSFQVLRARIDKFGVANPNIQKLPASGRIQVELPGVDNPERARNLLSGAAKLEFFQVYELDELTNSLIQLKVFVDSTEAKASTKKENTDLFKQKDTEKAQPFQTEDDTVQSEEAQPFQTEKDTAQSEEAQPFQTETDTVQTETAQPFQNTDTTQANTTDSATTLNQDTAEKATIPVDSVQSDSANNLLQGSAFQEIFLVAGRSFNIRIQDTARVNRILAKEEVQAMFPQNVAFMWAVKPFQDKKSESNPLNGTLELYFIKKSGREGKPLLEGNVISNARPSRDEKGQPSVSMTMNIAGAKKWAKITEENKDKRIAIVLDDVVYSAPNVMGKISGGQSSITGDFTVEESQDLANILKSGKLPAPLRIVEEAIVGPSLGEESIAQGLWSIVVGIGLVIVFMGFYYSSSGLVANLALILNVFFIFGILVPLGAVLTLPGIAGIVLTIGMAVDA